MKTIILFFFLVISFTLQSQNVGAKKVTTAQVGTVDLISSSIMVQLDDNVFKCLAQLDMSDYTVILTPVGNCGALRLKSKREKQFEVELIDHSVVQQYKKLQFNYVVFVTGKEKDVNMKIATTINDK